MGKAHATRRAMPKVGEIHRGSCCVGLRDNNCSVGFAHENPLAKNEPKGRLKNLFRAFQTTFHLYFKHYLNQLLLLQLILQIRIINRRDNDAADAENPFEHDHRHQQFPRA